MVNIFNHNYGIIIMVTCHNHIITKYNKHVIPYINVKCLSICLMMYVRSYAILTEVAIVIC